MRIRKLVVVGLVGFVGFAASIATAEDAGAPGYFAVEGVDFVDPNSAFEDRRFELRIDPASNARFANLNDYSERRADRGDGSRRYEFAVTARAADTIDVSLAQRAGLGVNENGDIQSASRGTELRLGRLVSSRRERGRAASPNWYIFAASDDEALTWRPGVRNEFGGTGASLGLEDRVDIGDLQAGVTYEQDGWQASLAYVERDYSIRRGSRTTSREENFTGVTWTMRH